MSLKIRMHPGDTRALEIVVGNLRSDEDFRNWTSLSFELKDHLADAWTIGTGTFSNVTTGTDAEKKVRKLYTFNTSDTVDGKVGYDCRVRGTDEASNTHTMDGIEIELMEVIPA